MLGACSGSAFKRIGSVRIVDHNANKTHTLAPALPGCATPFPTARPFPTTPYRTPTGAPGPWRAPSHCGRRRESCPRQDSRRRPPAPGAGGRGRPGAGWRNSSGEPGINLLKIHGSLDEFAFNDGQDLLKLSPLGEGAQGVIAALESVNEDVHYNDPRWPGGIVKGTNEIIYKDNDGSMQFLRRTPLTGAFKFEKQNNQIVPNELLTRFNNNLAQLSELVSIGYGFSDHHINQSIRSWLEQSSQRIFRIVDPAIGNTPSMFLHLSPQIEIINLQATDYLDRSAGIVRSPKQVRERRLADWQRRHYEDKDAIFGQYMNQSRSDWMDNSVDWLKSLPWKDGEIDMEKLGLTTPEELVALWTQSVPIQPTDTVLDDFLQQVTGNHG